MRMHTKIVFVGSGVIVAVNVHTVFCLGNTMRPAVVSIRPSSLNPQFPYRQELSHPSGSPARPKVPIRRFGTDCLVLAWKRSNARGAKGAGHSRHEIGQPETGGTGCLWRRAAALAGWQEPCDGRLSCTDL